MTPEELASAVAYVRLLIGDTDNLNYILSDVEVGLFVTNSPADTRMAAAAALDTIANVEALLSKKIVTQDLSTDGPAVAKALRDGAALLRAQVRAEKADVEDAYGFQVVDLQPACPRVPELTERLHSW